MNFRDRLGGRVFTSRQNESQRPLELGAQWLHGDDERHSVFDFARRTGILDENPLKSPREMGEEGFPTRIVTKNGRKLDRKAVEDGNKVAKTIVDEIQGRFKQKKMWRKGKTAGDFFDQKVAQALNEEIFDQSYLNDLILTLNSAKLATECWVGSSLTDLSLDLFGSSEEFETDDVIVPQGLDEIIDKLAEQMMLEDKIRLNSEVLKITHHEDFCEVWTEKEVYRAENVICTIPLGVLQKKHKSLFRETPLPKDKVSRAEFTLLIVMKFILSDSWFSTILCHLEFNQMLDVYFIYNLIIMNFNSRLPP